MILERAAETEVHMYMLMLIIDSKHLLNANCESDIGMQRQTTYVTSQPLS